MVLELAWNTLVLSTLKCWHLHASGLFGSSGTLRILSSGIFYILASREHASGSIIDSGLNSYKRQRPVVRCTIFDLLFSTGLCAGHLMASGFALPTSATNAF